MNFPFKKQVPQNTQNYPTKSINQADCEIKVKRDKEGRIMGIARKGNCRKEDILAFAKHNDIKIEDID